MTPVAREVRPAFLFDLDGNLVDSVYQRAGDAAGDS